MAEQESIERDEPAARVFVPSAQWITAYTKQATNALYEAATRFAIVRAEWVASTGAHVDDDYIEDLVEEAFAGTWTGALTWDPARASLEQHVIFAIKCRSRHDYERNKSRKHVSLDTRERSGVLVAAEVALADRDESEVATRDLAVEGVEALRAIASADLDALRILDAYDAGAFASSEVREHAKLTLKSYRNAMLRLARYRKQLSAELLERARIRARGRRS